MAHAHPHDHGRHPPHRGPAHGERRTHRRLALALGLTLSFAGVEAIGGFLSGSLALLGDAGHMLSDSFALGLAAVAAFIARRPPSARHSFGLGRLETLAALFNALLMLGVVMGIAAAAFARLRTPAPVAGGMVMAVAGMGLAINLLVAWVLGHGEMSLNVRGALLHVIGDLLGSVAALLSGTVIYLTGWTPIDPLLALFVCLLILVSTVRLLRDSLHVVLEGVPLGLDLPAVGRRMAAAGHVESVHDLHIWTLASGAVAISAHVVLDSFHHWPAVMVELSHLLHDEFGIEHITLQPEVNTHIVYMAPPTAK